MKNFKYALCALAGLLALSSCSKAETENATKNKRSVTINISNGTRAVDEPVNGSVKSDYSSLYIYFTDGTSVVSSDVITEPDAITAFKATGKGYDNISSSITDVLVVANVKTGENLPVEAGTEVKKITGFAFAAASQQPDVTHPENTSAGGLQVTMIGKSSLTDTGETTEEGNAMMKADIILSPIVARVELSKELVAGEGVHSIKIDHVYLNSYYSHYSLDAASLVYKGVDISEYVSNLQNDTYGDEVKAGTKADAYHVFADGANTEMPHVILEVSGFFKNAANAQGAAFDKKYLTITKFNDNATAGSIGKIAANSIYKIDLSGLTVPASVLDPTPEAGRISLDVTVDVAEWTVVNVTPEL